MGHYRIPNNPPLTTSSYQFLCLPNELFPWEFSTRSLYALLPHACCMPTFLLDLVSWITYGGEHKSWCSSLWHFLQSPGISSLSDPNIPLCSTLYTQATRHLRLPQCCWYKSQVFWVRKSSACLTLKTEAVHSFAIRQGVTSRYSCVHPDFVLSQPGRQNLDRKVARVPFRCSFYLLMPFTDIWTLAVCTCACSIWRYSSYIQEHTTIQQYVLLQGLQNKGFRLAINGYRVRKSALQSAIRLYIYISNWGTRPLSVLLSPWE